MTGQSIRDNKWEIYQIHAMPVSTLLVQVENMHAEPTH
jgi:hypothetical protein